MTAHDSNIRSLWLPVALTKAEATRLADTIRTALDGDYPYDALRAADADAHSGLRGGNPDAITITKPARWYATGIDAGRHTVKIRGCNRYRRAAQAIAPAAAHGLGLAYGADEIRERNERMATTSTTTTTTTIDRGEVFDTSTVAEDHRNELCAVCGDEMQIGETVVDYNTHDLTDDADEITGWATAHASHVDKTTA